MDTNTPSASQPPGRTRPRYSKEFKAQLVAKVQVPGMSLASVAIGHGLNPNVVRCWVAEANDRALPNVGTAASVAAQPNIDDALVLQQDADVATCAPAAASFVPVKVEPAAPALLHIELVRGGAHVKVSWPLSAAAQSAAWLREVLR